MVYFIQTIFPNAEGRIKNSDQTTNTNHHTWKKWKQIHYWWNTVLDIKGTFSTITNMRPRLDECGGQQPATKDRSFRKQLTYSLALESVVHWKKFPSSLFLVLGIQIYIVFSSHIILYSILRFVMYKKTKNLICM